MNIFKEDVNRELNRIKENIDKGTLLNEEDLKIILLNLLNEEDFHEDK